MEILWRNKISVFEYVQSLSSKFLYNIQHKIILTESKWPIIRN